MKESKSPVTLVNPPLSTEQQSLEAMLDELDRMAVEEPDKYRLWLNNLATPASSAFLAEQPPPPPQPPFKSTTATDSKTDTASTAAQPTLIRPRAGYVIKTLLSQKVSCSCLGDPVESSKTFSANTKVFINLCHSPEVPAPPPATQAEIQKALQQEDTSSYRVPLSLVGPKLDVDHAGRDCLVFDACVHTDPFHKSKKEADYKLFLIELCLQWIELKHSMPLVRPFSLPKMSVKGGALSEHTIYRAKRPTIEELVGQQRLKELIYTLQTEPPHSSPPEFITITVDLPELTTTEECVLEIDQQKVWLEVPDYQQLELVLPWPALLLEAGAQFHRGKQRLTMTVPVDIATAHAQLQMTSEKPKKRSSNK